MSLLSIITDVCAQLSLPQPTAVVGSTDSQVQQLLALANKAGRELARDTAWQVLLTQQTFTTTASPTQAAALPADFDRFVPDTFWNRTTRRAVSGPITPQVWQALQAQPALQTVFLMYRERDGVFLMSPTPPAGQTIAYEYVSINWAKSAAAVPQAAFLADADTSYLDESLIEDSLVWRFLRAKGLDYAEEMATFERNKEKAVGRDGGSGALYLSSTPYDLNRANLPDGNFPGP